jgi:hypothetical protein
MEKMLGRYLETWEQVHHIDHDGGNNGPSNLRLTDPSSHTSHHLKTNPSITERGVAALNAYAESRKKPRVSIFCACGCGETLVGVDPKGRDRKFISGHNQRGDRHWKRCHAKIKN